MRLSHYLISLSLSLSVCADEAQRPADGSVSAWGSCEWDGGSVSALCASPLICTDYGLCAPPCRFVSDCQPYGFATDCALMGSSEPVCIIECDASTPCPAIDGAELSCSAPDQWCF